MCWYYCPKRKETCLLLAFVKTMSRYCLTNLILSFGWLSIIRRKPMSVLETAFEKRNKKQNKVETIKALKLPMEVHVKLEAIAAAGYDALDKEDSAYFLKCFGLFDKGEDFMLRVRIPIGQLSHRQAVRIGEVAKKYGDDYIDLTTRMQIELRYLKIENIAKVLQELQEVGLSTFQTGVDNPRNIVADPLEGLAFDNIIDVTPIVKELQSLVIENTEWISALPRKFNTGILGSLSNSCNIFGHDCCFALANKEGEFGFNVYLGARVGIQSKDANVFVTIQEVPSFFMALLETFKTFGYRDNRNKNRLHFLLQDVGVEAFVQEVKNRAGETFNTAGQTLVQSQSIALGANKVLQRNGKYAHKIIIPSGIFSGTDLIDLADRAKSFGSGDLRLTYDQNIYVVNLDKSALDAFESTTIFSKYNQYNNLYFNDMIACAGTKTCSFGVIPNKPDAIEMANFLKSEVAIENGMVRMNWSACPKGCGVHGIADIGFEGCKAKDDEGNKVDGVHIFMGGKITRTALEAKLLHKTLPITEAKYHVKYLLEVYAEFKQRGETFETFENRYFSANYSYQALAFYTKINYVLNDKLGLNTKLKLDKTPKTFKKENLEIFDFGLKLFKLLTNEKRYVAVEDFEPVLVQARHIKRNEVSTLNPNVPAKLSEVIYMMTDNDKKTRAAVFSELLMALKAL
ncbi:MAG: Ferredoxin--nitrite reductase (EC [uncultured Sulfurovum sp.]|uniref:Ferredoxin--nitrite reductase (EC) n=1 Tax=uncultured Sulfurovum sp. TaxID=269237 RepID=A0A6S6T1I9_9BACT|nr:MAG: Ferredoxin--nitrite reductase (EC [uncultured Sulfurovum sp.]